MASPPDGMPGTHQPGSSQRQPSRLFRFRSVKWAFLAVILPLVLAVIGLFLVLFEVEAYHESIDTLLAKQERILSGNSIMLARAVANRDEVLIATHAAPMLADPYVLGIFVYDAAGAPLAEFGTREAPDGRAITGQTPVRYATGDSLQTVGRMVVVMTDAELRAEIWQRVLVLVVFAVLLSGGIVLAAQLAFDVVIGRALRRLQETIERTRLGMPREEIEWHGTDEVAEVIDAFNRMQKRQAAYESALDEARLDLEHRVEERTSDLRRARDEAEAANRSKTAFLANMSHELRTPLNAIIGFAEVLKKQKFGPLGDDRYGQYSEIVLTSGTHLLDLINDLLDLSKAEAGSLVAVEEAVSLEAQFRRAIEMNRSAVEAGDLTIAIEIDDDVSVIRGDARLIMQMVSNLVTNAVKFTRPCGRIWVGARLTDDKAVAIFVSDTGIGIPRD